MGAAVFFRMHLCRLQPSLRPFPDHCSWRPLRVIILVAGAFFWLVSLLLTSVVWFILVHVTDQSDARLQYGFLLFGDAVSVLLQEVFRFAYYELLKKADEDLASLSEDEKNHSSPSDRWPMILVCPSVSLVVSSLLSILWLIVIWIHGDSPYYFLTSAFLTAAIILLHTFWGVVFFDACEKRWYWVLGLVVGSHLLTSRLTFLNPWYEASLLPIYAVTVSMEFWVIIHSQRLPPKYPAQPFV